VFSVWDLRNFKKGEPLAKFTTSSKPITSCEWHGTDESMIVVSDEDAVFVYDLSIEEDAEEAAKTASATLVGEKKIPPQLLFMHLGSQSNKEAHWHPQIPSMIMSTALSGFNVFIPSNL
jgi:ribosome assembly protein RRB1